MKELADGQNPVDSLERAHLDFISTISHEIRTPLTSIRGFVDTMLTSYDRLDDDQKRNFLNIIKEQSNRLIKLTENVLAVSKIEQSHHNLVLKSVDIKPKLESVIRVIGAQYKNRRFKINADGNLPKILVDEDKFEQIMINLLENAAKYSQSGTEIVVACVQEPDGKLLDISVTNYGSEIVERDIAKIFKKFARLDNPLTSKVQGSGLGLYIVKTLTEQMQGLIGVKSSDDKTCFSVKFPIASYEIQSARAMEGR